MFIMPSFLVIADLKLGLFLEKLRTAFKEIAPQFDNPSNHQRYMSKRNLSHTTVHRFLHSI